MSHPWGPQPHYGGAVAYPRNPVYEHPATASHQPLRPGMSSDLAIALQLQEQEVAWSQERAHLEHQHQHQHIAGPGGQQSQQQLYKYLSGSGATSQAPTHAWWQHQQQGPGASDSSAEARCRLAQRIAQYKLQEHKVQGDGNCLFRALADQLWGDERRHATARQAVHWQLATRPDLYSAHVANEDEPYAVYCRRMAQPGQWGDHLALQAAADAFSARVVVLTSFRGAAPFLEVTPRSDASPSWAAQASAGHSTSSSSSSSSSGGSGAARVLYISYHDGAHYNSLYPAGYRHPSKNKVLGSKKLHKLVKVLF